MEKFNIFVFAMIMVTFVVLVALPADPRAAEVEALREMPELSVQSLLDNTFNYDYEAYLSDNVALRSVMLDWQRIFEYHWGVRPSVGFIEATERYILFHDRIMETFHRNTGAEAGIAQFINDLSEAAHENVRVFSMTVPTPAEFLGERYRILSSSQREAIDHINGLLRDDIIVVDVYGVLEGHLDEYIFFRTDHHWTALGAYYAYLEFARLAGFEPYTLDLYYQYYVDGFLGFLYNERPTSTLRDNADRIYYFILRDPYFTTSREMIIRGVNTYAPLFIQGDWDYFDFYTSVQNGRTAVVVKDSFANCFVPFIAPHYERVIVIDPRHFEEPFSITEELALYDDVDLIILTYIFSATFPDFVAALNEVM